MKRGDRVRAKYGIWLDCGRKVEAGKVGVVDAVAAGRCSVTFDGETKALLVAASFLDPETTNGGGR